MKKVLLILMLVASGATIQAQVPTKTELVKINGIEIYYEAFGTGKPLLLLHGWIQSSSYWKEFIKAYGEQFKVYSIDLRGHGQSSALTNDFSIAKSAEDVLALIDYLELEKIKAIGLSFGSQVLLEMVKAQPDRIESMVLISASHNYSGKDNQANEQFKFENLPAAHQASLRKIHVRGEDQIKALFDPELNYEIRLSIEDLQSIKSKTLIVHGDRDQLLGIKPAMTLHEHLPNSSLWIIPNAGHLPISDSNRDEFLRLSAAFLTD